MEQLTLYDLLDDDSFIRWVEGSATGEERRFWDDWIAADPGNRSLAKRAQEVVTGFRIGPVEWASTDLAYGNLESRLRSSMLDGSMHDSKQEDSGHESSGSDSKQEDSGHESSGSDSKQEGSGHESELGDSRTESSGHQGKRDTIGHEGKKRGGSLTSSRPRRHEAPRPPLPFRSASMQSRGLLWMGRAVAAVLLLTISGSLLSHHYQLFMERAAQVEPVQTEVTTDFGEQKMVSLSDGSEIILNGNTTMQYTSNLARASKVDIHLEGEAFFSIVGGVGERELPFRVHTNDGVIEILGTRLAVSTRDRQTRVVLEKGRVVISDRRDRELRMVPGQLVEFSAACEGSDPGDPACRFRSREVDAEVHTAWIHGRLVFEKETLSEVLRRLEHTYGVSAVIRDSSAYHQVISGSIESSDLEIITSALTEMFGIPIYVSEENQIIVDGNS